MDLKSENNLSLGNLNQFAQFYEKTHLRVFRFIFGLHGGPAEEIEDLTADTYMRAWKSRCSFTGGESAATGWLFQIARNLVIDSHRRRKFREQAIEIDEYSTIAPSAPVELVWVGEVVGEYVKGGWKILPESEKLLETQVPGTQVSIDAAWDPDLPQSTLRWKKGGRIFELQYSGGEGIDKSALIRIALGIR
jgi:RNA polymerase sigma factor (sigma-70 family)